MQRSEESDLDLLAVGARLAAARDWGAAKATFEAALRERESAEALSGLGEALFFLGDLARAMEFRERAYVAFRDRGESCSAARLALWLSMQHIAGFGNVAVANGWLGLAERLVDGLPACPERGWVLLRRSRYASDPVAAEALASEALQLARTVDDRALEIAATSQRGRALLAQGRVDPGFACLDEAMAAATGGELRDDVDTFAGVCCDMIGACEKAMELERATQWCQVTEDFARRINFLPIFAFCRVTYAGVLISIGRWAEAESQLLEALRGYDASFASQRYMGVAKLAELRLLQGRDAEAEALLAEHLQRPGCAKQAAMLQLARGETAAAVRLLDKRATDLKGDLLLSAPVLALLVEARLANGDVAEAAAAAQRLAEIAATTGRAAFAAGAALAAAQVSVARKDPAAVDRLEEALQRHETVGMPLPAARARLALARCLMKKDPRAAREACRLAVAAFEELGAKRDLDGAADLRRRLGVGAKVGPRVSGKLTKREDEVLGLLGLGLSNADIGRRLFISPKTVEHHVGHIFDKLDVTTRAAAAAYAVRAGSEKPGAK